MRPGITAAALASALAIGTAIGYVDSRPTWDDTGLTAGLTFLSAAMLSVITPRVAVPIALAIGLPIVAFNVVPTGNFASVAALGIATVGAAVGYAVRRFAAPSAPKR